MLIYKRALTFLNKHNMISEVQNGFREKKSTNTTKQTFIEDIQKALELGAGSCHLWLVSYGKEILIKKGFYCTLSYILFCAFLRVVVM
jgi:hypothetical protein